METRQKNSLARLKKITYGHFFQFKKNEHTADLSTNKMGIAKQ